MYFISVFSQSVMARIVGVSEESHKLVSANEDATPRHWLRPQIHLRGCSPCSWHIQLPLPETFSAASGCSSIFDITLAEWWGCVCGVLVIGINDLNAGEGSFSSLADSNCCRVINQHSGVPFSPAAAVIFQHWASGMASLIAGKRQKSSVSPETPQSSNLQKAPSIKHQTSSWSLASRPRPHPRQKLSGSQKYTSRPKVPVPSSRLPISIPLFSARVQAWSWSIVGCCCCKRLMCAVRRRQAKRKINDVGDYFSSLSGSHCCLFALPLFQQPFWPSIS